jgi:hypothetical protein
VTAVLIPIQIAVFIAYPYPKTVAGWYMLLQDKPLVGLIDLDLVLVVDNVLLVVIALAIYVTLRAISPSVVAAATGLWLLAIGMFIASNPAVQMLKLSEQFATAATDEQRSQAVAAGQAMLATWEGSAFQVSYVVGQLAGILIGIVMLRTRLFGRLVPYVLIIGNVVGFGYYLPKIGLAVSAFSGVVLWVWYIARRIGGRSAAGSSTSRAGRRRRRPTTT